ncbi:ribose transport system permease protein [Roseiarcus fermentans]|uniref:Ribose transport system permease protein n=1 Tax=Roseiarcus fermentans TaxID=1473586 RepID=A0A366FLQ0_9HYPH|nr:ABC transporter permease [Roseiarcus fermentans]RBP15517.1 ribose transport system permease protein [Roseiarcus fermentans]
MTLAAAELGRVRLHALRSQEAVVFLVSAVIFGVFALTLQRFLTPGNLSVLVFNMSLVGILGCGMAVVVIGRGVDLSMVSELAVVGACFVQLLANGLPMSAAIPIVVAVALLMGGVNGVVIAFFEVPALFATLASGLLFFGASRAFFLNSAVLYLPAKHAAFLALAGAKVFGVPLPALLFLGVVAVLHLLLTATTFGHLTYAQGDNFAAARNSGAPVRGMIVIQYMIAALTALLAGFVFTAASAAIDMQITHSTLIFDVVLVVVLGGVSLAGGRGGMLSVVAGALLIGILTNGMIILNVNTSVQGVIKGLVLVVAILLDRFLHPVDEETAKQGDTL